ncbi:hypothetical protein HUU05_15700 [candidate division KSB1 bacterium]|nr:hypothetical protein [candidate division KSB1 bacterium]
MLSVKGVYNGKVVKPLARVLRKPNTLVIITFLEEETASDYEAVKSSYRARAKNFDFGETPGKAYAREILPEYFSTFSRI